MKHDAIVEQGIPIHERVEIPDELIPQDSRVEIDAKIHAGYCECLTNLMVKPATLTSKQSLKARSCPLRSSTTFKGGLGRMLIIRLLLGLSCAMSIEGGVENTYCKPEVRSI